MLLRNDVPKEKSTTWFAWYPVTVPEGLVWLEYVLYYEEEYGYDFRYYYMRINGKRNENIPL